MDSEDNRLDRLLRALGDRTRRALLDRLRDSPGLTLTGLVEGMPQSRQALSKHVAMLEDADLVIPVWRGREKHHYLNPVPLNTLPARWVTSSAREDRAALKSLSEALGRSRDGAVGNARAASDPIAELLRRPPALLLRGQPVFVSEALAAALDYLADTARAVGSLAAALGDAEGYAKPDDGSFSLVEHLWHLADLETLGWRPRFERILGQAHPRLPGIDGDRLAASQRYQARPWRAAARRFVAQRRRTLAVLARFDAEVLRRAVTLAGARARAGGVVAAAVAHDLDHRPAMAERWLALRAAT